MPDRQPEFPGFNTMAPGVMADTAALCTALRAAPPVFWAPMERSWVLHRQAEVSVVLANRSYQVADLSAIVADICTRSGKEAPRLTGLLSVFLPFINPPAHDLERRYLKAVLSTQSTTDYAPVIDDIARRLLTRHRPGMPFDAATEFADLIPPLFFGHFLGLKDETVIDFVLKTAEMGRTFDRGCSPRYYARIETLIRDEHALFVTLVQAARRAGAATGLSRMIALADEMTPMSDAAIADHAMFLIMAASENTSALIANTIIEVMEAGLCDRLRQGSDLRAVVEETLRFAPPVQQMWRIAAQDTELGGARIAAGDRLMLLTAVASRDPAVHENPDLFDPTRTPGRNFGFGMGAHHCLGSELAMLEAEIALRVILEHHPRFDPAHPVKWRDRQTLRRPEHFFLHLSPERAPQP